MFHALCECCATSMIGTASPDRTERAWRQAYRAVGHHKAKAACRNADDPNFGFPSGIREFARTFVDLQESREDADYDPKAVFRRPDVLAEIAKAQLAISALGTCNGREKSAFAALVLFKLRP